MLTLDTATITAALSSEAAIISLYDVSYNEVNQTTGAKTPKVLYMTDHAEAVTYNSNVYNPAVIKRTGVSTNAEGESEPITISIGNIDVDRTVQQLIEMHDVIGQKITVREMLIDPTNGTIIGGVAVDYVLASATAKMGQVDFQANMGFDFLKNTLPGRKMFQKACRWVKFGDEYCKKVPAQGETCKRTYTDCCAKGNQANFGGAPAVLNSRIYF